MAVDIKALQATGDALLEAGVSKSASFQDQYLATHGRYAQCVKTPYALPSDGVKLATDPNVKPYYQQESWSGLGFAIPATSEVSMRIDVYDGPKGKDWAAVTSFVADGVFYYKTVAGKGTEAVSTDWVASEKNVLDDPVPIDVDPIGVLEPDLNP